MTQAAITDATGRVDAAEFTATSSSSTTDAICTAGSFVAGVPVWIEFDLRAGSVSPLASVQVSLYDGSHKNWSRQLTLPATWQRYRFQTAVRGVPATALLLFTVSGAGTFDVGRTRVYHAREPIPAANQNGPVT